MSISKKVPSKIKNASPDLSCLDPEDRMKKLINYGTVKIDHRLNPSKYFTIILESLKKAERLVRKGDLESAFIIYLKYINFCTINMKDAIFQGAPVNDKAKCQLKLKDVIAKKDKLYKQIIEQYQNNNKLHLREVFRNKERPLHAEPKQSKNVARTKLRTIILPKNLPSIFAVLCKPIRKDEITTIAALLASNDSGILIITDMVLTNYLYFGDFAYKGLIEEIAFKNDLTTVGYIHYHKYSSTFLSKMDVLTLYAIEKKFCGAIAVVVSYLGTVDSYVLSDVTVQSIKHAPKTNGTVRDYLNAYPPFLTAVNVISDRYENINVHDVRTGEIDPRTFYIQDSNSSAEKNNNL